MESTELPAEEKPAEKPDAPKDLWVEALNSLPESKQEALKKMGFNQSSAQSGSVESSIEDLVGVVNQRQEECENKFWKVKFNGEEIVLRNYTNNIVDWLGKAGDIAVQFAPPQAAIPWSVIKSVMQVISPTIMPCFCFWSKSSFAILQYFLRGFHSFLNLLTHGNRFRSSKASKWLLCLRPLKKSSA